jgi:hypothetical protein
MVVDIRLNKAASIERGVARAREESTKGEASFVTDHTGQGAPSSTSNAPVKPPSRWGIMSFANKSWACRKVPAMCSRRWPLPGSCPRHFRAT